MQQNSPRRRSLPHKLADDLARHIRERPNLVRLPSLYELARSHKVAYGTMQKAVRLLASRGIVECAPGKGVTIPSRRGAEMQDDRGEENLYQTIHTRIVDGTYPAGQALPRVNYFAKSECVSPNAILYVFKRLEDENFIHKRGKFWIAGPAPLPSGFISSSHWWDHTAPPVVVLLTGNNVFWYGMFTTQFTSPFAFAFVNELTKYGVQMNLVLAKRVSEGELSVASGIDQARSAIAALGKRYRGTIMVSGPDKKDLEDLEGWVSALHQFGRPVVMFDFAGRGTAFEPHEREKLRYFYRFHRDEEAAVSLALETLVSLGHESVAMPDYPEFDWIAGRINRLKHIARKRFANVAIHETTHSEPFWNFRESGIYGFPSLRSTPASAGGTRGAVSEAQHLMENTPSLAKLLRHRKISALLAPCDGMGIKYLLWLHRVGIEVPKSVSLLSFDNNSSSSVFPLSSIDFGFSRLGYLAAHLFIGDTPAYFGKNRDIPGKCSLIDRGSLGPPGGKNPGRPGSRTPTEAVG